jgi:signal transduction histidine kinase
VTEIAAAAVEFYQPAAELKGSMVVFKGGAARSRGDPLLLAQALGNLIDNALKYSPDGGVITVTVEPAANGDVIVSVADRGPGIADAEKPKVVERFYRGDPSRGTPGVGLGLSLVDAVARLHGSPLELEDNQPGLRARMVLKQNGPQIRNAAPVAATAGSLSQEPAYR